MDSDSEEIEDLDILEIKPRAYQLEILQLAKEKNIIAFLDTGSGKTLIALMLMKETSGKCLFLAPVRILVKQQSHSATLMGIPNMQVVGDSTDKWEYFEWQAALSKIQCFFMTPEILLNCLRSGYLNLDQFSLLVFDECHHCIGNSAYLKIMIEFYHTSCEKKPKILGLTASPVGHSKTNQSNLKSDLQELCNFLDSSFAPIDRDEVQKIANDPRFEIIGISVAKEIDASYFLGLTASLPNSGDGIGVKQLLNQSGPEIVNLIGKKALNLLVRDIIKRIDDENCIEVLKKHKFEGNFTNRFEKLLEILEKHFENSGGQVIVMVQKRIVAWYLSECINFVNITKQTRISSEKLIGKMHNSKEMGLLRTSDIKQREIIDNFKAKKFLVLVSTTVAEEGLDIPSCDLVIRFDSFSNNLRSYVQSKGRARDQDSRFVILAPKGKEREFEDTLKKYDETLKFLKGIADNQICPNAKIEPLPFYEVPSQDLISFCTYSDTVPKGARVCKNWSSDFLEAFCRTLNKDEYHKHKIEFSNKYFRPGECTHKVNQANRGGYLVFIKFPKILAMPEIFGNSLHSSEQSAKQDSALQAVKVLYERGYLNKHLKPIWTAKISNLPLNVDDPDLELVDEKGPKLRPKRKIENSQQSTLLPQDICIYNITGTVLSEFYVYNLITTPKYPNQSEFTIGVLSPFPLDCVPFVIYPFNLFKYSGIEFHTENHQNCRNCQKFPYTVTPQLICVQKFTEQQIFDFKIFHYCVNAACKNKYMALKKAFSEKSSNFFAQEVPVCFLPIHNGDIDFSTIDAVVKCFELDCNKQPYESQMFFPGCVIRSKHLKDFYFYLREINNGLNYEFEDKHYINTLKYYYLNKYGISLKSQQVIEVRQLGNFRQAIRPQIKLSKLSTESVYLPLELCEFYPVPAEIFLLCRLSPNIFHKLNQCFLTKALNNTLQVNISHNILIEAITCGSALEGTDYQRLEILGDSILKFVTSEYLYQKFPQSFEGVLTQRRMDLTSNNALFRKAIDFKIYKYIQAKMFNVKNWRPQGLDKILDLNDSDEDSEENDEKVQEILDEIGWDKILEETGVVRIEPSKNVVELSNKQLADCIEAIIGAGYLSGGLDLSRVLIQRFGIVNDFPVEYFINQSRRDFAEIEEKIGYRFVNVGVLDEAMTHTTANKAYNYDRLEFLGDALLDYIVLEYLFTKFPQAGPGSLSKMKSMAVSNRTFSFVSHCLQLSQFLEYSGSEIRSDLMKFSSNIAKIGGPENLSKLPDVGIKVMADLFEAMIGAVYIDCRDIEVCRNISLKFLGPIVEGLNPENCNLHPHNRLFDFAQKNKKKLGNIKIERFKIDKRSGIEFVTRISIEDKIVTEGKGPSKLASSENAAEIFFSKYGNA